MAHVIDGVALDLERLNQRVRELESRVSTLESQQRMRGEQSSNALPKSPDLSLQRPHPPATWRGFPAAEFPGGAVPVLGKAVLGIAGAYLLRAIAESNSVPKLPILLIAIVYAALWIVWAVRTHAASRFASVTYAFTSVLILSPLLWESTVRFQTLAPSSTATVLVAFTVLALALSWRLDLQLIPWIATLATVLTAVALIVQTHELVPLTAALLAVALAAEAAACLEHRFTLRAVPAHRRRFRRMVAGLRDDISRWSARGLPSRFNRHHHDSLPASIRDLWSQHRHSHLRTPPPHHPL